ncbi:MAG: hypothetical protein RLW62_00165 [Gammaproteobacteria bacterium]
MNPEQRHAAPARGPAGRRAARLFSLVVVLCAATPAAASGDAASFLTFESVNDGRCLNLSEGGKLRILRNTHASRDIAYRLTRMFAGNHPQGLSKGRAPAGGEPVKLGCTRVDGREQDWIVERAHFETPGESP